MKQFFLDLFAHFTGLSAAAWNFIEPILAGEAGKLLQQVLPIALGVVTQVATTDNLPNAKRDLAYSQLKTAVTNAGISAGTSVLNAAIELAYQHLQAQPVTGNQSGTAKPAAIPAPSVHIG